MALQLTNQQRRYSLSSFILYLIYSLLYFPIEPLLYIPRYTTSGYFLRNAHCVG